MLPPTIPIFPLPTVVLFPNVFLPLHIFEPRYRQMIGDALSGGRLLGMALPGAGRARARAALVWPHDRCGVGGGAPVWEGAPEGGSDGRGRAADGLRRRVFGRHHP